MRVLFAACTIAATTLIVVLASADGLYPNTVADPSLPLTGGTLTGALTAPSVTAATFTATAGGSIYSDTFGSTSGAGISVTDDLELLTTGSLVIGDRISISSPVPGAVMFSLPGHELGIRLSAGVDGAIGYYSYDGETLLPIAADSLAADTVTATTSVATDTITAATDDGQVNVTSPLSLAAGVDIGWSGMGHMASDSYASIYLADTELAGFDTLWLGPPWLEGSVGLGTPAAGQFILRRGADSLDLADLQAGSVSLSGTLTSSIVSATSVSAGEGGVSTSSLATATIQGTPADLVTFSSPATGPLFRGRVITAAHADGASTSLRVTDPVVVTFDPDPGGSSVTATAMRPGKRLVVGVSGVVVVAGTGCTSVDVGTATDQDLYVAGLAVTAGASFGPDDSTAATPGWMAAAEDVVVTAAGGNCIDLSLALSAHYLDYAPGVFSAE